MTKARSEAAIGLGGNLGDPRAQMKNALKLLSEHPSVAVTSVAKLYQTAPWGNLDQPAFLNTCALVLTDLDPKALLEVCLETENELGRVRNERWGPRTIDLDVLFFADLEINAPGLQLPHPRMTERGFVMIPLADIAPYKLIAGQKVQFWADELASDDIEVSEAAKDWWKVS